MHAAQVGALSPLDACMQPTQAGALCGSYVCPIDSSDDLYCWWERWEPVLRNDNKGKENDDGTPKKPSYQMELVPHRGTRAEFVREIIDAVPGYFPHKRRVKMTRQVRRIFDDHKSGARVAAAEGVVQQCRTTRDQAIAALQLANARRDALAIVARVDPLVTLGVVAAGEAPVEVTQAHGAPMHAVVVERSTLPSTLAALASLAARDALEAFPAAAFAEVALAEAVDTSLTLEQVHARAALVISVQSDYAAQLETPRACTATCASRERNNMLVSIVGCACNRTVLFTPTSCDRLASCNPPS